jgi:septal ring factor EnvC (AmiA/AmiB activator)
MLEKRSDVLLLPQNGTAHTAVQDQQRKVPTSGFGDQMLSLLEPVTGNLLAFFNPEP